MPIKLRDYLNGLIGKMAFEEELYGIRLRYAPILVKEDILVLDKRDGKLKWLKTKRPLDEGG
ncbi:hypothetical protein [Palaeococcus ferrophilus]|uniref:hypothetical protein n=1 Tax=Palaeococcus ferrophilus TaxID=83868 RepID=UPI000697AF41|nr:hypothetical protein [Palaeococcus ferrophilus]